MFGDIAGIVWNRQTGHLVCGHQRVDRLRKAGGQLFVGENGAEVRIASGDSFPVRVVDWPEGKEKAANVAANNPMVAGEFTSDISDLLDEIRLDIGDQAFGDLRLDDLFTDVGRDKPVVDDDPPETPQMPVTRPGDVWTMGKHRLVCGDSLEASTWARLMDGVRADLLLTDPPYNIAYAGGTRPRDEIQNDSMDDAKFRVFLKTAIGQAFAHMHQGASFYVWHADSEGYNFRGAIMDCGETVRQCLIWAKDSFTFGRQDYQWKHEPCLYGWKGGAPHSWFGDRTQATILTFSRPKRSEEHPTMKPVDLFGYLMTNSSKVGDVVIDPFLGSGTTVVAAEQLDRVCYGIELDPKYCDVIVERWQALTGGKASRVPS